MSLSYSAEEWAPQEGGLLVPLAWEPPAPLAVPRSIMASRPALEAVLEAAHSHQIRDVFEQECAHVRIDQKFLRELVAMEARFVNKKPDHIEFFGGTLTGVHVVRFTNEDRDRLFTDLLEIDDRVLQDKLYSLRDPVTKRPVINQDWKISSDVFNISIVWLLHAIENSPFLDDNQKTEGKIRACQYMLYKFLTSRLFRHFPYPADREIAQAAYAQLTYKFALKQYGSWGAVIRHLATQATSRTGIHKDTIKFMADDVDVGKMLNDIQGRPRDILKNFYGEFLRVHKEGKRIARSSALVDIDGEIILKDKVKGLQNYTRYIRGVMVDENSFIRQELVDVIVKVMHTMPQALLMTTLSWSSRNFGHTREQLVERAIDLIAEHAFAYLSEHRELVRAQSDLPNLVSKLRGAYMSSRSSDPKLLEIRDLVGKIVAQATKSKNESVIAATRTGFMIYVIVRMFSMRHYTS